MQPDLKNYREFKDILENYHASQRAIDSLKGLQLVLFLAATATGKNTLISQLLKSNKYRFLVSDTTRPKRVNMGIPEEDGREYWFRSEEDFLEDLRKGEYLEAELIHEQQVSGISIRELEKAKRDGKIAVTDIDVSGIKNVIKVKPDTCVIMLLPPSFEEWQRRIMSRGKMEPVEYIRRLNTALRIFRDGLENDFYKYVIAEDVIHSAAVVDRLVSDGHNPHQTRGKQLLVNLIEQLEAKLDHDLSS